jgi:hypothetical protein
MTPAHAAGAVDVTMVTAGGSATATGAYTYEAISIGEIAGGTGTYSDNDWVFFGKTFSSAPFVVVNAYDATGKPLIAGVRTEAGVAPDTTGFTIKLQDLNGNVITSGATVQWVAILPVAFSSKTPVQARFDGYHYDGERIFFDNTFSSTPIVICCAYDETMQYPIIAAPYDVTTDGFNVSMKDFDGNITTASVFYIAIEAPPSANYYSNVSLQAGYTVYDNNETVNFNLTRSAKSVLCSAQCLQYSAPTACASAAINCSQYGFDVGILDYDGNSKNSVWVSWIAFGIAMPV